MPYDGASQNIAMTSLPFFTCGGVKNNRLQEHVLVMFGHTVAFLLQGGELDKGAAAADSS
jgi:hypothetical protein